ncbi:MAG: alpha/beta hydrolase [Proteobacteria bacterium]|nr:alpha/beta hydrolase [Pseudomonadota bacterium]
MSIEKDAVIIETNNTHKASVIWLHGLGADGHDFEPIVPELELDDSLGIRFIFPNAPIRPVTINGGMAMRAWYDVRSPNLRELEDKEAIIESSNLINRYIQSEIEDGIAANKILLAGFSQGGAISLHTGLRYPEQLAGLIALSAYLPLPNMLASEATDNNRDTPVFMAHGLYDPVIPIEQGRASYETLKQEGYLVNWNEYTMQHAVCLEEINAISTYIRKQLS